MRYRTLIFLIVSAPALWSGCSEGLDPSSVSEPGFGGTIRFIGKIPPSDSLRDLRIVAVPYYPIDTLFQPLILKVVEGIIPFSGDIRSLVDSGNTVPYTFFLKPGSYPYVAIVQQYGIDVFSQWRVVSVLTVSSSSAIPRVLIIRDGEFTSGVNFTLDFDHLPPQPFRTP